MKIEDIKCEVEGVTYRAHVAETRDCTGCVGNDTAKLCNNLGSCFENMYFEGSPLLIWKEVPGDVESLKEKIRTVSGQV